MGQWRQCSDSEAVTSVSFFPDRGPGKVVVRREGLEPSSPEGQRGLSPPCMPIPAPPQGCGRHATNCPKASLRSRGSGGSGAQRGPQSDLLSVEVGSVIHFAAMTRATLERRLTDIGVQLRGLRRDLAVANEQLDHFADEANDARIRSLVSETPIAEREHRVAARHFEAMERHRNEVMADIGRLELQQDELLDRLNETIA